MRSNEMPKDRSGPLSVLHIIMSVGPTNGQYNEHCLPFAEKRRIGICSFFKPTVTPPPTIEIFGGNGKTRGLWRALKAAQRSRAWDAVHAHAPPAGIILLLFNLFSRRSMANTVYTVQNSYGNYRRRRRLLLYPIFARYARIIVCSEAVLDSLPRALKLLARHKLTVVPNAVDTERIDRVLRARRAELSPPGFKVVSIGRLIDIKSPHTLFLSFEAAAGRSGKLMFIGDGPLRSSLEQLVAERGLASRVSFTGLVERDDVYRLVSEGNVFVSTSRGEGMPVAVLEAMACARPVVLSDIPPHREIAKGASFISLVPPDDVDRFAREIRRIRDMAPDRRGNLGLRCREIVLERFGLEAMQRAVEGVYRTIGHSDSIRAGKRREERRVTETLDVGRANVAFRGRWLLVALLTMLGAGAGYAATLNDVPAYRATTSVIVGHALRAPTVDDKDLEVNVTLANTYTQLVRRQPVLQPVIAKLALGTTWQELRRDVRASVVPDTSLISITVDAPSPDEAKAIATEIANGLVALSPTGVSNQRLGFLDAQTSSFQQQIEREQAELARLETALAAAGPGNRPGIQNRIDEAQQLIISLNGSYATTLSLLAEQRAANQLDVLELAAADPEPIIKDPVTYAGLGALAGLFAGLGLAYALFYLRHGSRKYEWSSPIGSELRPARTDEPTSIPAPASSRSADPVEYRQDPVEYRQDPVEYRQDPVPDRTSDVADPRSADPVEEGARSTPRAPMGSPTYAPARPEPSRPTGFSGPSADPSPRSPAEPRIPSRAQQEEQLPAVGRNGSFRPMRDLLPDENRGYLGPTQRSHGRAEEESKHPGTNEESTPPRESGV